MNVNTHRLWSGGFWIPSQAKHNMEGETGLQNSNSASNFDSVRGLTNVRMYYYCNIIIIIITMIRTWDACMHKEDTVIGSLIRWDGYRSLVRSFVRNGVVQIPKFDAKPNPNPNAIRFGQMTLRTSELTPMRLVEDIENPEW